ncbi:MAG TPA: hypothetical protein VGL99_08685, partial [Chloroflexota bacterium]
LALELGNYANAATLLVESLTVSRELGDPSKLALVLEAFAELSAAGMQAERALRLAAAAEVLREAIGRPLARPDRLRRTQTLARRLLPRAKQACIRAEGRALSLEQALEEALAAADAIVPVVAPKKNSTTHPPRRTPARTSPVA